MDKTLSARRLDANRRNAQKSTGPRTAEGRAKSSLNAVKHGILSKQVLVQGLHIRENRREFEALHQRFVDELQPVGPVEEMLVDQIVTAHWRLRRALTAESGEIALSVDAGHEGRERMEHSHLQWLRWRAQGDPVYPMQESAFGNRVLEHRLLETCEAVEKDGELTEATVQKVVKGFGGDHNRFTRSLEELRLRLEQNPEGLDPEELRQKKKAGALAFLNRELAAVSWRAAECEKREGALEKSRQAAAVLPSIETLEKIMRYETKIERQLYRAMSQLERLQRMRQGEVVPPPLTMEVSEKS